MVRWYEGMFIFDSSYTARATQTFNIGPVSNINGTDLFVEQGGSLSFPSVTAYTNTLSDRRSNFTLLSADETSTLDLSNVETFSSPVRMAL